MRLRLPGCVEHSPFLLPLADNLQYQLKGFRVVVLACFPMVVTTAEDDTLQKTLAHLQQRTPAQIVTSLGEVGAEYGKAHLLSGVCTMILVMMELPDVLPAVPARVWVLEMIFAPSEWVG